MPKMLAVGTLLAIFAATGVQLAQETVFKVNVDLVQVDAVVTDRRGRQVTDLRADDFEILQDGKPQQVTACSYVRVAPSSAAPPVRQGELSPTAPPATLRPEQALRSYALVVDDLGLSFESIARVRVTLKKFVEEQIRPGDLVAIVRTSAGIGALQQFTPDRRQLTAAVERIRWAFPSQAGLSSFAPKTTWSDKKRAPDGWPVGDTVADQSDEAQEDPAFGLRQRAYTSGTLAGIRFVLEGLRQVPGRKALILFSEQIAGYDDPKRAGVVAEQLDLLSDIANRAGVLIYVVDPRSLLPLSIGANDDVRAMTTGSGPDAVAAIAAGRTAEFQSSRSGLPYLPSRTGGLFLRDSNDLDGMVRAALDDLRGYYLLAYAPDASAFDARTGRRLFHKISVRVKREDLHVRSRAGFYGPQGATAPSQPGTSSGTLETALLSPFGGGGIRIRMTALFHYDSKLGSHVTVLANIDARDITFTPDSGGVPTTVLEVLTATFGDSGVPVAQSGAEFTMKATSGTGPVLDQGITLSHNHPVKTAGGYQVRLAIRDKASGKIGAANQFVDVPDVRNNRLALTGILLQPWQESATATGDPRSAALRVFRPADALSYGFHVLNPKQTVNGRSYLESQAIVYRDGQRIHTGTPSGDSASVPGNPKAVFGGGILRLGGSLTPGDYAVQVVVTDKLAGKKNNTATQWTDFQVAP